MKKILRSITTITPFGITFGQNSKPMTPSTPQLSFDSNIHHSSLDDNLIQTLVPLFAIGLVIILLIKSVKYFLDYKLKNKIIDRSISEQLAASILEKSDTDKKDDTIKWAFLLLGLSGGLSAAYYTKPLDIHSLAIITFCIGVSFLSYYFFLKKSKK